MNAVVHGQQEVVRQLEARGKLEPQLPNTIQEEQEDGRLTGEIQTFIINEEEDGVRKMNTNQLRQETLCVMKCQTR